MARKSRKTQPQIEVVSNEVVISGPKYRAGLYGRISLETEENKERGTIDTQIELMQNYVNECPDIVVEEVYTDLSFTGTNFDRPAFEKMIADAQSGRINCIIVKDFSRLGRNYIESCNYIERVFPFLNVRFIAVNEDFDSFRPGTDLMMPLKNMVNDYYSKDISKKVSSAIHAQWEAGLFHNPVVPYGYRKMDGDKNRIVMDELTVGYVRKIFDLFVAGKNYSEICRMLNAEGVLAPRKYRESGMTMAVSEVPGTWDTRQIKRILEDRHYIGDSVHGKNKNAIYKGIKNVRVPKEEWIIVENTHEPLISKEIYQKAQDRLDVLNRKYCENRANGTYREKNIFKGKVKCADCGKGLQLRYEKGKWFYQCDTYVKKGKANCTSHVILYNVLSNRVLSVIRSHMKACLDSESLIRKLNARTESVLQYDLFTKEAAKVRREIQRTSSLKAGLYQDYNDRLITDSEYLKLKEDLTRKNEMLSAKLDELLKAQVYFAKTYKIDEDWEKVINTYKNKRLMTKDMVDAFVEKIIVHRDGSLEIKLIYDDMLQEMQDLIRKRSA